ncbi:MAG TPA: DUF2892 domain-containing protein [Bacillales bacterium]|nr:DUF2892 domain-containing protein [Bacillales bacterium]
MKPNISVLNAMMRITCGLTAVAWATSRLVRRPRRLGFLIVVMAGAMKVAEGFFRYCVLTGILKNSGISLIENNDHQKENSHGNKQEDKGQEKHKQEGGKKQEGEGDKKQEKEHKPSSDQSDKEHKPSSDKSDKEHKSSSDQSDDK